MKVRIFLVCTLIFVLVVVPCSALSSTTYQDLSQSSSQVQNLISYAANYDGFLDSKYVVYQDGQYSYYIVWSDDLTVSNNIINGTDIDYIRYYREGTTGSYSYSYLKGTDTSFRLGVDNVVVGNLTIGMKSELFSRYYFEHYAIYIIMIICGISFANLLRRRY